MITVLTTTYNRSMTLPRLFESLCAQTCMTFEWLVVDDGSEDNTYELLAEYAAVAPFGVRVIQQLNSGKHVALNSGFGCVGTSWVFIVDSDDVLVSNAIEDIVDALSSIGSDKLVGVCYRKAYLDTRLVRRAADNSDVPIVMSPTEAGHYFKGDLAYVFKTEVLLRHLFPVLKGEKFVPELYVWNKVGDEGDIYFFANKAIYLCDYLEDGYSKNFSSNLRKNPAGFLIFYWSQIAREREVMYKVKYFLRSVQCALYILRNRLS